MDHKKLKLDQGILDENNPNASSTSNIVNQNTARRMVFITPINKNGGKCFFSLC